MEVLFLEQHITHGVKCLGKKKGKGILLPGNLHGRKIRRISKVEGSGINEFGA